MDSKNLLRTHASGTPEAEYQAPGNPPPSPSTALQLRDVFRELLHEKQIEGDELTAVFDELLAILESKVLI